MDKENTMRLIDANAVKLPNDLPYKASVRRVLLQAPTVDAVPVVHGRWVFDSGVDYCYKCSECKSLMPPHYIDNNYCPNCGARMDGEEADADD